MNLDKLNSWITLIANVGVLIGIVVLAIEVQQNNQIARGEMRMDISDSMRANLDMLGSDRGVTVLAKYQRGEEITIEDQLWLSFAFRNELKAWENAEYQFSIGLYDQLEYENYEYVWRSRASEWGTEYGKLFLRVFEGFKPALRISFREKMESFFQANNCDYGT